MAGRLSFGDDLIWCEECGKSIKEGCSAHGLIRIADRAIPSRARLTLPCVLKLQAVGSSLTDGFPTYGVFAKRTVQKLSNFGPAEGLLLDAVADDQCYLFKVFDPAKGTYRFLNNQSEDTCNWIMFVRPATNASEQNLVAYQHNGGIYMTACKTVAPGAELKFWYARDYALLIGKALLLSTVVPELPTAPQRSQHSSTGGDCLPTVDAASSSHISGQGADVLPGRTKAGLRSFRQKPAVPVVARQARWPCGLCEQVFGDSAELEAHACGQSKGGADAAPGNEELLASANDGGRRTRNKRKGRPKKVMTVGGRRRRKGAGAPSLLQSSTGAVQRLLHKCVQCPLEFSTRARLAAHAYVHTGERPFQCGHADCSKSFSSKFKLMRHELIHQPHKRHHCRFCNKPFSRRDHLKNHMVLHDDNRRLHVCEFCRKPYSTLHAYRTHVAYHRAVAGELSCSVCLKEFESKDTLVVHIKVHAGSRSVKGIMEKKFCCTECNKRFLTQKDVRRHQVTHTKEKNFVCQVCPQRFGRQDHLTRHLKKNHSVAAEERLLPAGSATASGSRGPRSSRSVAGAGERLSLDVSVAHQQLQQQATLQMLHGEQQQPNASVTTIGDLAAITGERSTHAPPEYVSISVFPATVSPNGQHQQYFLFNGFGPQATATAQVGLAAHQEVTGLSKRVATASDSQLPSSWQPVLVTAAADGQPSRYRSPALVNMATAAVMSAPCRSQDGTVILDCSGGLSQAGQNEGCILRPPSTAADTLSIVHDARGAAPSEGAANDYMEAMKALGNFSVSTSAAIQLLPPQTISLPTHSTSNAGEIGELYTTQHYTAPGLMYR